MNNLLNCPFCGSVPELVDNRLDYYVKCRCGATVVGKRAPEPNEEKSDEYWEEFKLNAINKWNSRPWTARLGVKDIKMYDNHLSKKEIQFMDAKEYILSYFIGTTNEIFIKNPYKKWYQFWKPSHITSIMESADRNSIRFKTHDIDDFQIEEILSTAGNAFQWQIEEPNVTPYIATTVAKEAPPHYVDEDGLLKD